MPRPKATPQPLSMTADSSQLTADENHDSIASPSTPSTASPRSPVTPGSPFRFTSKKSYDKKHQQQQQLMQAAGEPTFGNKEISTSQTAPSLSTPPLSASSGEERDKESRPARGGFFANYMASKSSSRLQPTETIRKVSEDSMSRDTDRPAMSGKVSSQETKRSESAERSISRKPVGGPSKSDVSLPTSNDSRPPPAHSSNTRKHKPKPFSLLRTRSVHDKDEGPSPVEPQSKEDITHAETDLAMRTAPPRQDTDRSFREMMSSSVRHHSEDRKASHTRENSATREKENGRAQTMQSTKESSGHTFFNNLKSSASKGAGAISKGIFGKSGRSDSMNSREQPVDDEHYVLRVINKPLVEQTRLTRISKRLEDSRDKTEFWMPAFSWRAIDYLNYKGSEMEGLYRVPGSGPQIKKWQRRFDEELDIDLFEQDDLYDINIIGSMLKAWLRELPDELLPKAAQDRIAKGCAGQDKVPQMLVDELSNLSPFNYYLLFAITCHLSLLLAHSDKNKMNFQNLCICFQPCMKMDAMCFKWLVCDWRDCWKGCKTEVPYIEQEYALFEKPSGSRKSSNDGRSTSTAVDHSQDERIVSSSDSSKPPSVSVDTQNVNGRYQKDNGSTRSKDSKDSKDRKQVMNSHSQASISTATSTLTPVQETPPRKGSAEMRPLSPIKPLSPIGFDHN